MKYYIDENNNLYEKSGIDYLVKNGIQTLEGLRLATESEVEDKFSEQNRKELIAKAIVLRDEFVNSNIVVDEMEFQVDAQSLAFLESAQKTIDNSDIDWKLANDELKPINSAIIEEVLRKHSERRLRAQSIFLTWKSEDYSKQLPAFK